MITLVINPEYSPLNRRLLILIGTLGFAIFSLLGIYVLRRGAKYWDSRLKMYVLLSFVIVLFGQGSVFLILEGLWGT